MKLLGRVVDLVTCVTWAFVQYPLIAIIAGRYHHVGMSTSPSYCTTSACPVDVPSGFEIVACNGIFEIKLRIFGYPPRAEALKVPPPPARA